MSALFFENGVESRRLGYRFIGFKRFSSGSSPPRENVSVFRRVFGRSRKIIARRQRFALDGLSVYDESNRIFKQFFIDVFADDEFTDSILAFGNIFAIDNVHYSARIHSEINIGFNSVYRLVRLLAEYEIITAFRISISAVNFGIFDPAFHNETYVVSWHNERIFPFAERGNGYRKSCTV